MAGPSQTLKQPVQAAPAAAEADTRTTEERLSAWVTANARYLAIGAGVIALVVLVTWFLAASNRRKEAFARQALEQAWSLADAGNIPQASSDLQRIATTYRGTPAAFEAVIALNQVRLSAGQHQLAVDDLQRFIESGPPSRFMGPARMLLGSGLENLGKPAEAAAAFEAASQTLELGHQKAEALLSAARSYRTAGQADKAIELYRRIVTDYRETAAFPIAEIRLGELTK